MKLFTEIYGAREYVRIHRNNGWNSDSENFLVLRWVGGSLCFACSCYTVSATVARDAQTDVKLPLKRLTCAAAHCMAGTANWDKMAARH
jgi:hypothetical protein